MVDKLRDRLAYHLGSGHSADLVETTVRNYLHDWAKKQHAADSMGDGPAIERLDRALAAYGLGPTE